MMKTQRQVIDVHDTNKVFGRILCIATVARPVQGITYRLKIYKLLNRISSGIIGSGVAQEF